MVVKLTLILKQKVYTSNPHTMEELKESIQREILSASQEELHLKDLNFLWGCHEYAWNSGWHFQHLL
jgi:hypothetical protein